MDDPVLSELPAPNHDLVIFEVLEQNISGFVYPYARRGDKADNMLIGGSIVGMRQRQASQFDKDLLYLAIGVDKGNRASRPTNRPHVFFCQDVMTGILCAEK
jgi:hypothetical protein